MYDFGEVYASYAAGSLDPAFCLLVETQAALRPEVGQAVARAEATMKAHYPAMYALMKTELGHRETLRSREQFLRTYSFMERLLKDIYGDQHEALLPEASVDFWAGGPRVELITAPGCGHSPGLDRPRWFAELVVERLERWS